MESGASDCNNQLSNTLSIEQRLRNLETSWGCWLLALDPRWAGAGRPPLQREDPGGHTGGAVPLSRKRRLVAPQAVSWWAGGWSGVWGNNA